MELPPDVPAYRAFVGPPGNYDVIGALQFNLLTSLGLREGHSLLDVGCGSLRGGRLFIPYLERGRYFGIEPERWLVDEGLERELGRDIVRVKSPSFSDVGDFRLTVFARRFDFIVAQSIFTHAALGQIRTCLLEAKRALAPGGMFAATFIEGPQDYEGDDWVYPGNVTYRLDRMRSLGEEAGFAVTPIEWPHPHGQRWLLFTHHEDHALGPAPEELSASASLTDHVKLYHERLARLTRNPLVRSYLALRKAAIRVRARIR